DLYKYPSLPPQMPWLDDIEPNIPLHLRAEAKNDGIHLSWEHPLIAADGETASGYVIYRFEEGEHVDILNPKNILKISFLTYTNFIDTDVISGKRYTYLVTALDRLKNESPASGPVGLAAR